MYALVWSPVRRAISRSAHRTCSTAADVKNVLQGTGRGLVLGFYESSNGYEFTTSAKQFDEDCQGNLQRLLKLSGNKLKKGDSRIFYDLDKDYPAVSMVCVGPKDETNDELECIDMSKESIRQAAAVGVKSLKAISATDVEVEDFGDSEAAAEGSTLVLHDNDHFQSDKKSHPKLLLKSSSSQVDPSWEHGSVVASAQNFARELMEMPCNYLTPANFAEIMSDKLSPFSDKMNFTGRPYSWIKDMKMGAFVSVAKGSVEEPYLLEMKYSGGSDGDKNVILVGKGVTFDTGGISIKPAAKMGLMKGDMGGAAVVCATMMAIAELKLPINVVGLTPLCENMPAGNAYKPGDVVTAMNGKTIEVDNTDAEGRLILADTLCYSQSFNPSLIIDLATLTGAIDVALGNGAAGVFANSNDLWSDLEEAGRVTGDRLWRMPLFAQYRKQMKSDIADINNTGTQDRSAGSCTAASFLKEFVGTNKWAHLDIAGVMQSRGEVPYLGNGMSGRPTRTLIQYLKTASQK